MYNGKQRKRNRRLGYDYSTPGKYYVTICTDKRIYHFGDIVDGKIKLNDCNKIVKECWFDLPNHYRNINLVEFIIMPNHVHGVIEIHSSDDFKPAGNVGTGLKPVSTVHGLSEIIRGFKTFSARKINEFRGDKYFKWQRSFHDHIIRDEKELNNICYYIQQNTVNWSQDNNNHINIK